MPSVLLNHLKERSQLTAWDESWLASLDKGVTLAFCLSGLIGIIQQKIGPLKLLIISAVFSSLSFACLSFTVYLQPIWLFTLLYIARVLCGVAWSCLSSSVYLTEVLPREIRGMFLILEVVCRSLGNVLVYGLGYFFHFNFYGFIFGWLPAVSFVWMLTASFESPVHLIKVGKNHEAKQVLDGLSKSSNEDQSADDEERYRALIIDHDEEKPSNTCNRCTDPDVWKPFVIVTGLQVVQQFTLQSVFKTYIVTILQDTFSNSTTTTNLTESNVIVQERKYEPYLGAVFIGLVRLVASLTLSLMVDKHRRRRIYLTSGLFTAFSLLSFAACDYLVEEKPEWSTFLSWLNILFVSTSTLAANWGVQTIPNLMASVLFPPDVRSMQKSTSRGLISLFAFCSLMVCM